MRNKKGFTLIELLVVIAIIGLLATLAVVALNNARQKSRDAKRVADVKQIQTALELFYNDNNSYPGASSSVPGSTFGSPAFSTYMATYPTYPTPSNDGTCGTITGYTYTASPANCCNAAGACTTACTSYGISFCLGATTGGLTAGTHSATPAGL